MEIDPMPKTEIKRKVTFDTTSTKLVQVQSNVDRPKMVRFSSFSFSFSNTANQPQPLPPSQPPLH